MPIYPQLNQQIAHIVCVGCFLATPHCLGEDPFNLFCGSLNIPKFELVEKKDDCVGHFGANV